MVYLSFVNFGGKILTPNRLVFRGETPEGGQYSSPKRTEQEKAKKELVEINEVQDPALADQLAEERYLQLENMREQALAQLPEGLGKGQGEKLQVKINDFIIAKLTDKEYDVDSESGLDKEEFELFTEAMTVGIDFVISSYQESVETFTKNGAVILEGIGKFGEILKDENQKRLKANYWDFVKPSNMFGLSGYLPGMEGKSFMDKEMGEIRNLLQKEEGAHRDVASALGKIENGEDPETAFKDINGPEGNYFKALATGKDPEVSLARYYLEKGEQIKLSGASDVIQGLASGFLNQAISNAEHLEPGNAARIAISSRAKTLLPKGFEKFRSDYLVGFADMFLSYDQLLLLAASGPIGGMLAKSTKLVKLGMRLKKLSEASRLVKYGAKLVPGFELFASKHGDKIGIKALKLLGNFAGEAGKIWGAEWVAGKAGNAVGGEEGEFYAKKGVALFCFLIPGAKPAFERGVNKKMNDIFGKGGGAKGEQLFKDWVSKNYTPEQIQNLVREGIIAKIEDAAMTSFVPFLKNNPSVRAQIETQVDACIKEFGLARSAAVRESAQKVTQVNISVLREKFSKVINTFSATVDSVSSADFTAFLDGAGSKFEQLLPLVRSFDIPQAKEFLLSKKTLLAKSVDKLIGIIATSLQNKVYSAQAKERLLLSFDYLAIIIGRSPLLKKLRMALTGKPAKAAVELVGELAEKWRLSDHFVKEVVHGGGHGEEHGKEPYAGDVEPVPMAGGSDKPIPMAGGPDKPVPVATKDQEKPPVG
ncbi:MAG: hypothetical protein WC285_01945 [Candidatus Gracilibacteria bacterium]|jgi:hypothetical protein